MAEEARGWAPIGHTSAGRLRFLRRGCRGRPGVFFEDIQRRAEETIRSAGYRDYFPHGIGHFVGLDVHDAGLYSKSLAANMVITVEPGIYIPERSLGVRIEDEVLSPRRAIDCSPPLCRATRHRSSA